MVYIKPSYLVYVLGNWCTLDLLRICMDENDNVAIEEVMFLVINI